jgi:hypothetical protein
LDALRALSDDICPLSGQTPAMARVNILDVAIVLQAYRM